MMLQQPRQQIDQIDAELVKLLEQRMHCVTEIARIKHANQLAIFDAAREQQVIEKASQRVNQAQYRQAISEIFTEMMRITKDYQATLLKQSQ